MSDHSDTYTSVLKLSPVNRQDPRVHSVDKSLNWSYQRFVRRSESIGPYLSLCMTHVFT